MQKKVLFITKNYPPAIGGEQQYCFDLFQNLKSRMGIDIYARTKGNKHFFQLKAAFNAIFRAADYETFFLGSGHLAPLGFFLKWVTGRKIVVTIHGQDIGGKNKIMQKIVPPMVAKADRVIAVSQNTKRLCIERGISPEKITVIPNGIDFKNRDTSVMEKTAWQKKFSIDPTKKTLVTVGRLVKRKGVADFITTILSSFGRNDYQYFVIGKGVMRDEIVRAIEVNNLMDFIHMTGELSVLEKNSFWAYSDAMLMPNIMTRNTPEGFGIVAIEAASWGLPVLACAVDGIPDAIVPRVTGALANNQVALGELLREFLDGKLQFENRDKVASVIRERYDWNKLAEKYLDLLR